MDAPLRDARDAMSVDDNCEQRHCSEYLTSRERVAQKKCMREVFRYMDPLEIKASLRENPCRFIDARNRLPVALVSAEGSGNTWLRWLLERASGACTGFIHCDYVMRRSGFIGEGVMSGSVLVVKTHSIEPQWNGVNYTQPNPKHPYFGSGILMIRNPYKSLVAEWNRRITNLVLIPNGIEHNESHTNTVSEEYWSEFTVHEIISWYVLFRSIKCIPLPYTGTPEWASFVQVYMQAWKERIMNWLLQDHAKVHVVYYEDLQTHTVREVTRLLDFLHIDYSSPRDVASSISGGYTEFKRPHAKSLGYEYYTLEQIYFIKSMIQKTNELLKRNKVTLDLDRYLQV